MVKWKNLVKRIPVRIKIANNVFFEILFTHDFIQEDGRLGEMRLDERKILIKLGQSDKETIMTYLHELLHAISDEHQIGLTESQIKKLEKAFYYVLKPGNIFK